MCFLDGCSGFFPVFFSLRIPLIVLRGGYSEELAG